MACGSGAVRLIELQRAGKKPMPAAEVLRGFPLPPGTPALSAPISPAAFPAVDVGRTLAPLNFD